MICIICDWVDTVSLLLNVILVVSLCGCFDNRFGLLVRWGRKDEIKGQFESVIDHARDEHLQKGTALLDAWISVHFYEPNLSSL